MKESCVPFNIAKQLKIKGFKEKCFAFYEDDGEFLYSNGTHEFNGTWLISSKEGSSDLYYTAPLYQTVVDWLREKYDIEIRVNHNKFIKESHGSKDIEYEFEVRSIWREQVLRPMGIGGADTTYYKCLERAIEHAIEMI